MKTRIDKKTKNRMGLIVVNGVLTDKYGRTFESYIDEQGFEDIRPIGVQRDIKTMRQEQC